MTESMVAWSSFGALDTRLARLANPDPTPLLEQLGSILWEDNRRGILAGTDGAGAPMAPVTYRGSFVSAEPHLRTQAGRGKNFRPRAFLIPLAGGDDNLGAAEYRRLSGPPLAPRGAASRVISNYRTRHGLSAGGSWYVEGAWLNVASAKGVPFLMAHFTGAGHLPVRDLRGLRPWGVAESLRVTREWINSELLA